MNQLDVIIEILEDKDKKGGKKPKKNGNGEDLLGFFKSLKGRSFEDLNYLRNKARAEGKQMAHKVIVAQMIGVLKKEMVDLNDEQDEEDN